VSGVTGSDLKKRIRAILMGHAAGDLNFGRKVALAVAVMAAFALPILVGVIGAPAIRAQSQSENATAGAPAFEYAVVSIKPDKTSDIGYFAIKASPDGLTLTNCSTRMLIQLAYGVQDYQILEGPSWITSETYDIDAKIDSSVADAFQKLDQSRHMVSWSACFRRF